MKSYVFLNSSMMDATNLDPPQLTETIQQFQSAHYHQL